MKTSNLWRTLLLSLFAVVSFAACSDDDEVEVLPEVAKITVDGSKTASVGLKSEMGDSQTLSVVSTGAWSLEFVEAQDWCIVEPAVGVAGTSEITFTVASALPEGVTSRTAEAHLTTYGMIAGIQYPAVAKVAVVQSASGDVTVSTNVAEVRKALLAANPGTSQAVPAEVASMTLSGIIVTDANGGNNGKVGMCAVQDASGDKDSGLWIILDGNTSVNAGDVVTVSLQGATFESFKGTLQLAVSKSVKPSILPGKCPEPIVLTSVAELGSYEGQFVKFAECQPTSSIQNKTWGEVFSNATIELKDGSTFLIGVNKSAEFNGSVIPAKSGSIQGVVGKFFEKAQLKPRNSQDIVLDKDLFTVEGGGEPVVPTDALYSEICGTERISKPYPFVSAYDKWTKGGSLDQSGVTYEGKSGDKELSIRSASGYDPNAEEVKAGVSGLPGLYMSSNADVFTIKDINVGDQKNLTFVYNAAEQTSYDSAAHAPVIGDLSRTPVPMAVSVSCDGGNSWSSVVTTVAKISADGKWYSFTSEFKLPASATSQKISVRIDSYQGEGDGQLRVDDFTLKAGGNGAELGGGETPEPPTPGTTKIKDIMAAGTATVDATIVAKNKKGVVLADETGNIWYYNPAAGNVGDVVTVSGSVTANKYTKMLSFSDSATATASSASKFTPGEPKAYDGAALEAWMATQPFARCEYVKVEGTYNTKQVTPAEGTPFTVYQVTVPGMAKGVVEMYYFDAAEAAAFNDGDAVVLEGYLMDFHTQRGDVKIVKTKLTKSGDTPEPPTPGEGTHQNIGELLAAATDTPAEFSLANPVTIVGRHSQAVLLADATGFMLGFNRDFAANHPYMDAVGKVMNVKGMFKTRFGMLQAEGFTLEETAGAAFQMGAPKVLSGAEIDAYTSFTKSEFIKVTGTLNVKDNGKFTSYSVTVDGSTTGNVVLADYAVANDFKDVANGDKVEMEGVVTGVYNGIKMVMTKITKVGGGETPDPTPGEKPLTWDTNLWENSTLVVRSYQEKGNVNGTDVDFIKLGSSKNCGTFTTGAVGVTGSKKLSFYAAAWTGKPCKLYIRVDNGGNVATASLDIKENAGCTGSAPYTITFGDADYYTVELTDLTAGSTITFSTDPNFADAKASATRVVVVGAHLQ